MSPNLTLAVACQAGMAAALAGLLVSRRWRFLWLLPAFLATALVGNALAVYVPGHFFVPEVWMFKTVLYDVLGIGIALELGYRVLAPFRGALATGRVLSLLLLGPLAGLALRVGIGPAAGPDPFYMLLLGELHPRVALLTLWLLAAVLGLSTWYRVPVHPFHLGVLASLGGYLVLSAGAFRLAVTSGWGAQAYWDVLNAAAYLALLARWGWLAWARENPRAVPYYEILGRLRARPA